MKNRLNLSVVFLSSIVFTLFFYKQALGINLLIYELSVLIWLYFSNQFELKGLNTISTIIGVIVTALFTVIHHSNLSYIVNFFVFFTFIGVIIAPQINSLINSLSTSWTNIFRSIKEFFSKLTGNNSKNKKLRYTLWRFRIFLIPLTIIILFSSIYSWANPEFGKIVNSFWGYLWDSISTFFSLVDISIIGIFTLGLFFSVFIFLRKQNEYAIKRDSESNESLLRTRKDHENGFKTLALVNEYKAAIFLFASLNVLLFGLNVLDINHIWFNFEWKGQYLKQFVHEGTYVLIFAIVISIFLVLYFFRGNINFYRKNKTLKLLCYIWIAQNILLAVSVGIRNWYYIQYYALAYKRIAIIFFLILTIYGLYSVFRKVHSTRSRYFLTKNNAYAWMIILIISTVFNWDRIIAQYNFENSKKSFVHLNYLSDLSNSALPFLEQPKSHLLNIDIRQEKSLFSGFGSSSDRYHKIYMGVDEYIWKIGNRKQNFKKEWESKGVLEWNYAEYKAYHELFD